MGNNNFEVTLGAEINEERKEVICLIKKQFVYHEELFEVTKEFFEKMSRDYDSDLEKRKPSNKQTFSRISGGLLQLSELLKSMESKLSLLKHEIQFLNTNINSTTDHVTNLFQDSAKRGANLVEELSKKIKEIIDIEKDILEGFRIIYET